MKLISLRVLGKVGLNFLDTEVKVQRKSSNGSIQLWISDNRNLTVLHPISDL